MAFISFKRDLDAAIKNAPFSDGQLAVAQDADRIYIDTIVNGVNKRVVVDNDSLRDQHSNDFTHLWIGTQAEYSAIENKDDSTLYITTDDGIDLSTRGFAITSTETDNDIVFNIMGEGATPFLKFVLA